MFKLDAKVMAWVLFGPILFGLILAIIGPSVTDYPTLKYYLLAVTVIIMVLVCFKLFKKGS